MTVGNENRFRSQALILGASRLISSAGTSLGRIALAFSVIDARGLGPVSLSVIMVAQVIPQLIGALFGGFAGDRFSRRTVIVLGDCVAAAAWLGLLWCLSAKDPSVLGLSLLAALSGLATVTASPALFGIVPDIFGDQFDTLRRANSLIRGANSLGLTLGLAGGGILISLIGPKAGLLVNSASFMVAAGLGLLLRPQTNHRAVREGFTRMLREGYTEFWHRRWLWVVVLQSAFYVAASSANVGVLGPLTAKDEYSGAATWSQFMIAQALGGILGAGAAARLRFKRPLRVAVLTSLFGCATCVLMGRTAPVFLVCAAFFLVGFGLDLFGVLWETSLQFHLDAAVLARVSSWDLMGSLALAPIGLALAGPLSTTVGARNSELIAAATIALATLAALAVPDVRNFTNGERAGQIPVHRETVA